MIRRGVPKDVDPAVVEMQGKAVALPFPMVEPEAVAFKDLNPVTLGEVKIPDRSIKRAGCELKGIRPGAATQGVLSGAAIQTVSALPVDDRVIVATAQNDIVPGATNQAIIAEPAVDVIRAIAPIQGISAAKAAQNIICPHRQKPDPLQSLN